MCLAPRSSASCGCAKSLERDPVALGLVGALILGSLAAAACAAVGLIVGAIVSTRERRTETALLRALGMSRRGVTAGVAIDNAYLLAFGFLPASPSASCWPC
jgi:ABC-type antimicrobial peptide transport system permease subunit